MIKLDEKIRKAYPHKRSEGRVIAFATAGEESPGSTETRRRITPGGGDSRESATESKPPHLWGKGERVR